MTAVLDPAAVTLPPGIEATVARLERRALEAARSAAPT